MKVLVVGGLSPDFEREGPEEECARAIGAALASNGHVVLQGWYNDFDRMVAVAAAAEH